MAVRSVSDDQINEMCKLYISGKTSTEISEIYNINSETVRKWMKRSGLGMRTSGESMSAGLDHHYFKNIDNENKAYWLGFLLADGCIGLSCGTRRSLRFYLNNDDRKSIEKFSEDIQYLGNIRYDKSKNQSGICFNSPILASDLIDHGMIDWKRDGNHRILSVIPGGLFNHFVRGFFDGDGCIQSRQRNDRPSKSYVVTFAADHNQYECMNKLEDMIIARVKMSKNGPKVRKTGISLRWNGNQQVKRFGEWLYKDANVFMKRKRDRFNELNGGCEFEFDQVNVVIIDNDVEYINFYDEFHYMGTGGRRGFTVGAYHDGMLIASCTFGPITRKEIAIRRGIESDQMRELVRFCIHPNYHKKNFASWFMGKCIKAFKKQYKNISTLVSFADTTEGHEGIIYKATNWEYDGMTGRSYHYEDVDGKKIHKKTIFDIAKRNGMKETIYSNNNNLKKIMHQPKHRYFMKLKS